MNIIICGAGRVGLTITKLLIEHNHSITLIDQSSEDIQKVTEYYPVPFNFQKYSQNSNNAHRDVFRANVEPDSRLGMGSLVDDSWDCWEKKDYETNPGGSVS